MADKDIPDLTDVGSALDATGLLEVSQGGLSRKTAIAKILALIGVGFRMQFDSSVTNSDPGAGNVRFSNASPASATTLYIDDSTRDSGSLAALYDDLTEGYLTFTHESDPTIFHVFKFTAVSALTGYYSFTVTWLAGDGSFTNDDLMRMVIGAGGGAGGGGGGGGLDHFDSDQSTDSPNTTKTVSIFKAVDTATDVDMVLAPKGSGGILVKVPDNSNIGGNKPGSNAVDLQFPYFGFLNNADNVAAGDHAALIGGFGNRAGGTSCAVLGGADNKVGTTATSATILWGSSNRIGADSDSNGYKSVAGGENNIVDSAYAMAFGQYGHTKGQNFVDVRGTSYGGFVAGRRQAKRALFGSSTNSGTPQRACAYPGNESDASSNFVLDDNSAMLFDCMVLARGSDGEAKAWRVQFLARRSGSASGTTIVGTITKTVIANSNSNAWDIAVSADTTLGGPYFEVTGDGFSNVDWLLDIHSIEFVGS